MCAAGALLGTLAIGVVAAPALPALGPLRDGPPAMQRKVPLGWRRAGTAADRVSYSNGLAAGFRSSATLLATSPCRGQACGCDRIVRAAIEDDLWRLADVGKFKDLRLGEGARLEGMLEGTDGQVRVSAICLKREAAPVALIVLQPQKGSSTLVDRMAGTVIFGAPEPAK